MGHYFIVDREATFAVAVQEALEERGHSAEIFQDPLKALTGLVEYGADVLILDLGIAAINEKQLVGTFRNVPETRSLPIVGLAENLDSQYSVDVLRSGLTDVLPRRLPLDELIARITRSAGRPTLDLPLLQGLLAGKQLVDFLEYLRHMGKSGFLQITSPGGAGRIEIRQGALIGARFKNLRGQAAVLAMLDQDSGKFKLEDSPAQSGSHATSRIDIQTVLLQAAWLSDKLKEHQEWVPRSGHEFELVSMPSPEELGEFAQSLPILPVLEMAEARPFIRLHELRRDIAASPQELRLVLAILSRRGSLRLRAIGDVPNTQELKSNLGVEFSILDLFQRAQQNGHSGRALSLLLVGESDVWPSLRALFARIREAPFRDLSKELERQDHGSVTIDTEAGQLLLHLLKLDPENPRGVKSLLPTCDGLLLWLGEVLNPELLIELTEQVPTSSDAIRGVVVAADPRAIEWSQEVLEGRSEWTLGLRPPSRLSSLLRCFYSRASEPAAP